MINQKTNNPRGRRNRTNRFLVVFIYWKSKIKFH
nr:MAG TPA: hypothetical protein [Caudoviricetes sp.]